MIRIYGDILPPLKGLGILVHPSDSIPRLNGVTEVLMSEGVYSAVPQPMKFTQISLDICRSLRSMKLAHSHPTAEAYGISCSLC